MRSYSFLIKLFGERNTGTNALTRIIQTNSESVILPGRLPDLDRTLFQEINSIPRVRAIEKEKAIDDFFAQQTSLCQWKHAAVSKELVDSDQAVSFIFMVRHPLSWLLALYRKPYHILTKCPNSLSEFAHMNWLTLERDNVSEKSTTPLKLYEAKLRSYKYLIDALPNSAQRCKVIKLEDLIMDQPGVFRSLKPALVNPSKSFQPLHESTKKDPAKNLQYYQDYYGKEAWRAEIESISGIDELTKTLDSDLFSYFGYKL